MTSWNQLPAQLYDVCNLQCRAKFTGKHSIKVLKLAISGPEMKHLLMSCDLDS